MDASIRPEGWENWRNPENEKTARYSEFQSTGPGANPDKRVKWSRQLNPHDASKLTVKSVLGGDDRWIPTK
jgi:pectinesterase